MFNLKQAITDWRQQMLDAGIQSPVLLEELESHLREEIERQINSRVNPQAAFQIAAERIGPGNLLKTEFKKSGSEDKIKLREKAGYFYAGILSFYSLGATYAMAKNDLSINEWLWGFGSLAALLIFSYLAWRVFPPFYKVIANRRVQSAIGLVAGVSGAIWFVAFANLILPHFDFTPKQLVVAVLWAMVPTLLLPNLAFLMLDKSESQPFIASTP
jgi:hypothetical protein